MFLDFLTPSSALLWRETWAIVFWHRRVDGHSSALRFRILPMELK